MLETVIFQARQETPKYGSSGEVIEKNSYDFTNAETKDLVLLRSLSAQIIAEKDKIQDPLQIQQAEQTYKQASKELFFRIKGDKYRQDLTVQEDAMEITNQEIETLLEVENIQNPETGIINYCKLIIAQAAKTYPQFSESEIRKVVYSLDFICFIMFQTMRICTKDIYNDLRGQTQKPTPDTAKADFRQQMEEAVTAVENLVLKNRQAPETQSLLEIIFTPYVPSPSTISQ